MGKRAPGIVAGAWVAFWTLVTWLLEGRQHTLLRPEAVQDRLVYTWVANLLVGIVGTVELLRWLERTRPQPPHRPEHGFGTSRRAWWWRIAGWGLGVVGLWWAAGPELPVTVAINVYAQVLPVSVAEIVVCWSLVAATLAPALRARLGRWASVVTLVTSACLFGAYHLAHSPPFDTLPRIALLSAVGLLTGAFFLASRDVLATLGWHNGLGAFGVLQTLQASDQLVVYQRLQVWQLFTALAALALLGVGHARLLGRRQQPRAPASGRPPRDRSLRPVG